MRNQILLAWLTQFWSLTHGFYVPKYVSRSNHEPNGLSSEVFRHRTLTVVKEGTKNVDAASTNKESSTTTNPTSRSVAVFTLMKCLGKRNRTFGFRQLENDPDFLRLEKRDRSFARLLFTTVERRFGQIDKVVSNFSTKQNKKPRASDTLCQSAILVGAAQILFLEGVAQYAAIHDTVEVLRMHQRIKVSKPQIKFVNAILRTIQSKGMLELETNTTSYDNAAPWLVKEWISAYGEEKANAIVEAFMDQSPIFISVKRDPKSSEVEHEQKLKRMQDCFSSSEDVAAILPHGSIEIPKALYSGSVAQWPLYKEGEWWIQDPSATLPAIALHNALCKLENQKQTEEMQIVDLCSAPGGKTAQLCSFGYPVTAIEFSKKRTRPLKENMKRLQLEDRCDIVVADGREWVPSTGQVYGVLADVPCSATGVGSRRPDVLRKSKGVLDELLVTQRELAVHAVDEILAVGGTMVYATCSLLKQESEDQVKWLLSRKDGAVLETDPILPGEIPGFDDAIDENGWLRVLPSVLPGSLKYCDGFFVARLKRIR